MAHRSESAAEHASVVRARVAAIAIGSLALVLHGFRVTSAPDIFGDEGLYNLVARHLATGIGLVDDVGTFVWHPPGYPLLLSLWAQVTGSLNIDFTTAILDSRYLNVIFSGLTAALLVMFGRRLLDLRAGILMGLLFAGDLFVQRINRRSMIETSVMFLMLIALYVFYTQREKVSRTRVIGAGLAFGAAILTKEVAAIAIVGLGAYVVLFQRWLIGSFAKVVAIAGAMYAVYVAWGLTTDPDRFLAFKLGALTRIAGIGRGLVPREARIDTGINPGIVERLGPAVVDFGPTYLLMAVGALALLGLLLRFRDRPAAQLVLCWGAVSYIVIGFGTIVGAGDHFLYYVLIPAIVAIGYVSVAAWPSIEKIGIGIPGTGLKFRLAVVLLVALASYDAVVWTSRYGVGVDDSYARLAQYVREEVPAGSTIVVGADVNNFLFRPDYDVEFYRDQNSVLTNDVRYFIMSSKEALQRYNRMTPEFYDWVRSHTEPMVELDGETYWTLGLYRWDDDLAGGHGDVETPVSAMRSGP
jgi:hypothetical protein